LAFAAADAVILRPRAKLNLGLAVLARRSDGFHEIESLMVPVSLADRLRVRARNDDTAINLSVRFSERLVSWPAGGLAREVPGGEENLVIRAARALAEAEGVGRGLEIDLVKEIPAAAGLGGGSSDAAAVLLAASLAWGIEPSPERLVELAAGLGSDVPWFLGGSAAIVRGRGEAVEPVAGIPSLPVVIALPAAGCPTAEVYRRCTPGRGARRRTAAGGRRPHAQHPGGRRGGRRPGGGAIAPGPPSRRSPRAPGHRQRQRLLQPLPHGCGGPRNRRPACRGWLAGGVCRQARLAAGRRRAFSRLNPPCQRRY